MRYLMLVYGNEAIWSDPSVDFATFVGEVDAYNEALRASGELVAAEGLVTRPHHARAGSGEVMDGPYLEAKEYVGSYTLLDVESESRALEIAGSYPGLRIASGGGGVEIWPLMTGGAEE